MNISDLLKRYIESPQLRKLIPTLSSKENHQVRLKGCSGSMPAFIAAAVYKENTGTHLFVLPDKEEAAFFLNNIENLAGSNHTLFYPASYRRPYQIEETDNANILLRAEVLNRIRRGGDLLIVTFPEAINEKVVTKKNLASHTMDIRLEDPLSMDFLMEFLQEYEFEHSDFVYEAGQFAIRGGIIDIYSYAHELPFRIELDGDKVESIRTFNPTDQLKVDQMNHVTLIPNVQKNLLRESRESFFDFIPKETKLWFSDLRDSIDFIDRNYEKTQELYSNSDSLLLHLKPEELFDTKLEILGKLNQFTVIEFGNRFYFNSTLELEFKTSPQPSFNKNFPLLIEDLQSNKQKGYDNLIFADAAKQIERLYAIFADIGKDVSMNPILMSIHEGFQDHDLKIMCYTDHQIFNRYHRFKLKQQYSKSEALTLKELYSLKPGDFVTHIDHGVGRFAGLEIIDVNGKTQEAVRLVYRDNDILYVSIHSLHRITRYTGKEGKEPSLNKLGSNTWSTLKQKTKKKVKDIAKDLIALYAKRKAQQGFAFTPDTYLQTELEASFIYEDTPDQEKATVDFKKDMEKPFPMDRLICGDVGFGKTEIAIRAAFKAVTDGKQVAVLVPTTILALQHYNTFVDRLKEMPCTVDYINRFKTSKQQKLSLEKLEAGKIDIIIGTHRLLGKDIKFQDLGLMIIDEEQKFGVAAKEKLKQIRINVDTLTLTATPIPRTLQFSLMGARDLSIITTPPPNRVPVTTELHIFSEETIRDAIMFELERGGQVFFVHNRVQDIHDIAGLIKRLVPDARIAVGHGQMDGPQLEDTLLGFIDGDFDVLVATTIIESGLDIPNANTIIIQNAHHFGLSDLHQMRGRVGRSNRKAFCYLLSPPVSLLTSEARQRLRAIEEFSDLGSGFNIAMRDLDIRGAGNLLGGEQSGFISEIGYEMYHKILDEAIRELKESDFKDLFADEAPGAFVQDCQIDTDMEILIPNDYVNNITERLSLYRELDSLENEKELLYFEESLKDRFGPVPFQVEELMETIRLRWKAKEIGIEKFILKNQKLIAYFVADPNSAYYQSDRFSSVLKFVQSNSGSCKLKEEKGRLSIRFNDVKKIGKARQLIEQLGSQ